MNRLGVLESSPLSGTADFRAVSTIMILGQLVDQFLISVKRLRLRDTQDFLFALKQDQTFSPRPQDVAKELGIGAPLQFVLRIGYLKSYPDPVSPRMPVSWFTSRA